MIRRQRRAKKSASEIRPLSALPHQQSGNHEPGNDEENVYSYEATAETGDLEVNKEDEKNGESTETFHVGPVFPIPWRRACLVANL